MSTLTPFTEEVLRIIKHIPSGRVLSYGRIAAMAGNPGGARQVARILHSLSKKHELPWHRVVNVEGKISLPKYDGYDMQKALLEAEGIKFDHKDQIDLDQFLWQTTDNRSDAEVKSF